MNALRHIHPYMKRQRGVGGRPGTTTSTGRGARRGSAAERGASGHAGEPRAPGDKQRRVVRVAIVGGGCGGLAAAWHLTRPGAGHAEKYDVTVYERSWRLGGKAASGRGRYGRLCGHGVHNLLGVCE